MNTGPAHQHLGVFALLRQHHGDDVTRTSSPGRTPGTMQVSLVLAGRIDVHHQFHVVNVHATRGDIGGYQHPGLAVGERGKVAVTCGLRQVAVQVN